MKLNKIGALAAVAVLAFAACSSDGGSSAAPSEAAPSQRGTTEDPLGVVQIPAGEPVHVA